VSDLLTLVDWVFDKTFSICTVSSYSPNRFKSTNNGPQWFIYKYVFSYATVLICIVGNIFHTETMVINKHRASKVKPVLFRLAHRKEITDSSIQMTDWHFRKYLNLDVMVSTRNQSEFANCPSTKIYSDKGIWNHGHDNDPKIFSDHLQNYCNWNKSSRSYSLAHLCIWKPQLFCNKKHSATLFPWSS